MFIDRRLISLSRLTVSSGGYVDLVYWRVHLKVKAVGYTGLTLQAHRRGHRGF
jgi:hypothetical protein